jgi:V-type H+-transporting ATPase subunit C
LASVVPPSLLVRDSEYLETHLIAVPNPQAKDFLKSYETLIEHWVVPRSATQVDSDKEYTLFTVTTFQKYSQEFIHKVREKKWTPRDFKYKEGGEEEEKKELKKAEAEERRLWGETLRLARTSYSEAVEDWIHVLALRVFVETVLRYGLPLSFVCGIAKVRINHPWGYFDVLNGSGSIEANEEGARGFR